MSKKTIVISAINFFEGGPLSVLKDCLAFLTQSKYLEEYRFIAIVHKKDLFYEQAYENIVFLEFPKSRKSYVYRLFYEYVYFKKLAKEQRVCFWLSLHDITPNVGNVPQAVYCHNPSPFNTINLTDIFVQPTQFFFRLFYKYLYQINIHKNRFVIVQQLWIKHRFKAMFNLNGDQIIIAPPQIPEITTKYLGENKIEIRDKRISKKMFFFPAFPRPFKNIEVICEAILLVCKECIEDFEVIITINGSENKYSKKIVDKYRHVDAIKFVGLIEREEVYKYYAKCDCLIFPSKLETWGLPLSEFKQFSKPIFVSDLPYAKETVGKYEFVNFFNPDDAVQLSKLLICAIKNKLEFDRTNAINYEEPFVNDWNELFAILLK